MQSMIYVNNQNKMAIVIDFLFFLWFNTIMPKTTKQDWISGKRLRAILSLMGWTGTEFARRHGLSLNTINQMRHRGSYGVSGNAKALVAVIKTYEEKYSELRGENE
ncbi:MAG: hypothetical protein ACR2PR_11225 [Pseudohongiellaceae bacterium]